MSAVPVRAVRLGRAEVEIERRADGSILLRSPHSLAPYGARLTERLVYWAAAAPARPFLAQRTAAGAWRRLAYGDAFEHVRALAQALIERRLSAERPLAILSENDLEHALLALAAMHAGIAFVPVSPAYSLLSADFAKLKQALALLTPGLVYASDAARYGRAIAAAVPSGTEIVTGERFHQLAATRPTSAVEAAHAAVGPDTVAKFLLTSGSTGQPKAVINTQRMLCSNQQMLAQSLPSLAEQPPVLVDWLPWNHTAGANHNLGIVLSHGGTLYIDEGRPLPGLIEKTVRNLREIAPTIYFNVPRGYEALLPYLRADRELRRNFFSRLGLMQYAAAVLPQPVWRAYEDLAQETCGERVLWITGYGSTETAPFTMSTNRGAPRAGSVGLPVDGAEMKLVPVDDKLEVRFRGPHITPGYWRQPELSRAAFDEEGYYRTGDAMRFLDPADPSLGLEFDGRIAEDFKLSSGTWARVGPLRARINAAGAPWIQDSVITGHDRDELGALVFPSAAARELGDGALRAKLERVFAELARESSGSSNRVARAMVLEVPPSIDAGEVTDKGSINQRAVLRVRSALVEQLYADPPASNVIQVQA
ncbi:MAG TPA: feruloyl-CoA synthase [Burkholderiales bacterium]|nr:feruloyl-CoA synthase [Burkholderiales bacterium]